MLPFEQAYPVFEALIGLLSKVQEQESRGWVAITADPETLPPVGVWVIAKDELRRYVAILLEIVNTEAGTTPYWKLKAFEDLWDGPPGLTSPTHWRSIE